jgi:DNA modification methylase
MGFVLAGTPQVKTYLSLINTQHEILPSEFQDDDVRYPASLVEHFLLEYTHVGDKVFDPFSGYGTTLTTAEAMGRVAYGVELNESKFKYARARLQRPERLIHGDSRLLANYNLPQFDFSMTSPPYTSKDDALDPLTDYTVEGKGYAAYLRELRLIYGQLRTFMKPAGIVVIEVANIKRNGRVTSLAWDIAGEISHIFHFEGEVVVCWDQYGYGYDHSYCLVFSAL